MSPDALIDRELIEELPLPLAQLYLRAHHAKTPLERHQAAYYLWEASLKLLASVAVVEYAAGDRRDEKLAERLKNLARPSLGHWWEFVRLLVPVLAQEDEHFQRVQEMLLGGPRDDMPAATGLEVALRPVLGHRKVAPAANTVRLNELFDHLVRYRAQEIGHGAAGARNREFYDSMARTLLAGVSEILRKVDLLAGRCLVYVADVRRLATGPWLIERFELRGLSARRLESLESSENRADRLPHTERIYLSPPGSEDPALSRAEAPLSARRWLHPMVIYDAAADEAYFLNGRRGRRKVEYLSYTSGNTRREELAADQRELLVRVLGGQVDEHAFDQWADNSLTEEKEETPIAADAARPEPKRIGEFELLSRIGQGGMGTVYRAWQPSLGRQVALKRLVKFGDPKAQQRFQREIRALGCVDHPNLVKIFASGSDGEDQFFAMELVEGTDLGDVCCLLAETSAAEVDQDRWQEAVSTACQHARTQERSLSDTWPDRRGVQDTPAPRSGSQDAEQVPPDEADIERERTDKGSDVGKASVAGADTDAPAVPSVVQRRTDAARRQPRGSRGYIDHAAEIVRQMAEAAHALHEHGIIHRDIKPGNIMLTQEGHAVLMDLGLAQLIDDAEGRMTRTGQFVGTVRYSSPEQLLSVASLDRRSDVYSLGATLWELLTLQPMFGSDDQMPIPELMLKVQSATPEKPGRYNPRIPSDLQAVVLKCLEKDRTRRYATAADLAEDLARWQHGDPVLAQPPSLHYVLGKYARRHVGKIAAAAVLVLILVAGSVAGFVEINAARREAVEANRKLEDANRKLGETNRKLEDANSQLRELNEEAAQARKVAEGQAALALRTLQSVIFDIQRELAGVPAAHEVQRSLLETALDGLKQVARSVDSAGAVDRNTMVAHHDLGDIFYRVGGADATEQARQQYERALAISERLAAADPQNARAQIDLALVYNKIGNVQLRLGATENSLEYFQKSLEIREHVVAADPRNVRAQREVTISHNKLGDVQLQLGATQEALEHYQKSLEIREHVTAANPDDAQAQRDLAISYFKLGEVELRLGSTDKGRVYYQKYHEISDRLAAADPGDAQAQLDLAIACNKLGDVELKSVATEKARRLYQQSLEIRERLAAADPDDAQVQRALAISYFKLADVEVQLESTEKAREYCQKHLEVCQRLAKADPLDVQAQRDLAVSYSKLGDIDLLAELTEKARESYQSYFEISKRLAEADPSDARAQRDLAIAYFKLGDVQLKSGPAEPAREYYQKYLDISERLAEADPRDAQVQLDIAVGYCKLGQVDEQSGDHGQATTRYMQGLEMMQSLEQENRLAARPEDAGTLYDVACSYARAADAVAPHKEDDQLSDDQRQLKADLADNALLALRYAVALGYRKLDQLQTDPDLQSVRDTPVYQEIMSELKKTTQSEIPTSTDPKQE